MTPTSIETMTGQFVDLVNPDPMTINIRDIAWATSRMPRYVGHTTSAVPYTIGQHSIFVTTLVQQLFRKDCIPNLKRSFFNFVGSRLPDREHRAEVYERLEGAPTATLLLEMLMHDASEAYIVDVPTPLKEADGFRQVYLEHEVRMTDAIRLAFNMGQLDPVHEVYLKWADRAALTIEAYHLIASRGRNWTRLLPFDMTAMQLFEAPKEPIKVYEEFLNLFGALTQHP
jgi:hypothetical protein